MGADPAKSDWEIRFGNKRRRIDRELLANCEAQLAAEERRIPGAIKPMPPIDLNGEERKRIALAFGRPPQ
jgi:hypothetical protein